MRKEPLSLEEIARALREGMIRAGVPIDADLEFATSKPVRFAVPGDKRGRKDGWYQAHADGNPTVCFGWWGHVDTQTYSLYEAASLNAAEREAHARQIEAARQARQKEEARRRELSAGRAVALWEKAEPAPADHAYLMSKGISEVVSAIAGLRVATWDKHIQDEAGNWIEHSYPDALLLPLYNAKGELRNLQAILPEKVLPGGRDKDFLAGGEKAGCFYLIGIEASTSPLLICEGFATGASLHTATGYPVAVAFDCGNLKAVVQALRLKYPNSVLMVAGDNDAKTTGNPGETKAREAAEAVGIGWCVARFESVPESEGATDFNDLHRLAGCEEVKRQIEAGLLMPTALPLPDTSGSTLTDSALANDAVKEDAFFKSRFELRDDGLHYIKVGYDSRNERYREEPPVKVCAYLEAVAMVRDKNGFGWSRLLRLRDHDMRMRRLLLPDTALEGEGRDVTKPLRDAGLWIADNKSALLKMYLNQSMPTARALLTSRIGWHEDIKTPGLWSFVFPDEQMPPISPPGAEPWIVDVKGSRAGYALFKARGSLAEWRDNVGALACGNSRLIVALCAGLASGLTWLHPNIPGGLHWAGGSSLGKSALLYAVASLCGAPNYRRTWMQTGFSAEWLAAGHSDSPLLLDELKRAGDPEAVSQIAYMFASGSGKARGQNVGGLRDTPEFSILFQSNGEIGLDQFLRENGKRSYAGQEVRFCELPGDAGKGLGCWDTTEALPTDKANGNPGAAFTDHINAQASRFYGTAYPAWLEYVSQNRADIQNEFNKGLTAFESANLSPSAGGQVRRVLVRFAAFALAGELATEAGILPLKKGEACDAASRVFREWVEVFGGEGNQEPRRMVAQVREWLQRNGPTRLGDMRRSYISDTHSPRPADCGGWRRPTNSTKQLAQEEHVMEYLIYPAVFRSELAKGFDPAQVAKELDRLGFLDKASGSTRPQKQAKEPGASKPSWFYVIKPAILEGGEDA